MEDDRVIRFWVSFGLAALPSACADQTRGPERQRHVTLPSTLIYRLTDPSRFVHRS